MEKRAFIFPGQGAQVSGMGKDFFDAFEAAREVFQEADEALSLNLSKLIFSGSQEELTLTLNAQPAIFVVSAAILKVMEKQFPNLVPAMCGGLSLGEYSALYASKRISFADCVRIVRKRGELMQEAALKRKGGMTAVLGLEEEVVKKAGYWIANVNCPGQVVIAGPIEEMEKAQTDLKERGARRVIPLEVSGAFHSKLMNSAQTSLRPYLEEVALHESAIELVMNVCGDFVSDLDLMREYLIQQVVMPTRWLDCMHKMIERAPDIFIEVGPSQLTAMNKKITNEISSVKVERVEDLEGLYDKVRG